MNRSIFTGILAVLATVAAFAQSGTNSPYSQYGIGLLTDQSQGFNRGMNGVGLGLRRGNVVNTLNPASYSAVDSLTMIFDVGLSGQMTNFKEGSTRVNASNADFEYFASTFRLRRHVGMSFGLLPYSNVGYGYSTSTYLDATNGTIAESYSGSGGLHQAFLGIGWRVMKPLSVGVNVAYLWGTLNRSVSSGATTTINSLSKVYTTTVNNYDLEFGLQWNQPLGKKDDVTLGATVGIGHKLGADPTCEIINNNSTVSESDTTRLVAHNGLSLPMTYGLGVSWNHNEKWVVAADFTMQQWGSVDLPAYDSQTNTYAQRSGLTMDRYKVNLGADYVPAAMSRRLVDRIHYRFGAGYATPYYKINGKDGPKELSVSAGLGIPLQNAWSNRSVLNISAQWARTSAKDLIVENTFRINIGLTFNERWFAKWRID